MRRKGVAPLLFAVFVLVFAAAVIFILIIARGNEVTRATEDTKYQIPVNTMELIYSFMRQSLLFSSYQASAQTLESGGLVQTDGIFIPDNYEVRDNIRTAYWYDTRHSPTETYPGNMKNVLQSRAQEKMMKYMGEAKALMERTGPWKLPSPDTISISVDDAFGSSYAYNGPAVEYADERIELKDISSFAIMSEVTPLKIFDIGFTATSCFIANEHIIDCATIVPPGFLPLRTKIEACVAGYSTTASATRESACGGPGYPSVTDQDVYNDNDLGTRNNNVRNCITAEVNNNNNTLNSVFGHQNVQANHHIYENNGAVFLSGCSNTDTSVPCTITGSSTERQTFFPPFFVDASGPSGKRSCSEFYDNPNHFCDNYFPGSVAESCFYDVNIIERYKWDPNSPPDYKGEPTGAGTAVTSVTCVKTTTTTTTSTKYIRTRSCTVNNHANVSLTTNIIDKARQYPYYSVIDNPSGETKYRDMALRFLVRIEETNP